MRDLAAEDLELSLEGALLRVRDGLGAEGSLEDEWSDELLDLLRHLLRREGLGAGAAGSSLEDDELLEEDDGGLSSTC